MNFTAVPPEPSRRRSRRLGWLVAPIVITIGALLVWVAAPSTPWLLPGQTVTIPTGVEYPVNGRTAVVGVVPDGSTASVHLDGQSGSTAVEPGDQLDLGWGAHLTVVEIDGPQPGDAEDDGGIGTVTFRLEIG